MRGADLANCDHVASATAIAKGIAAHSPSNPGYWIHTSGTGILTWQDFVNSPQTLGMQGSNMYDDWEGISKILSIPDQALHRPVDKIVLAAGSDHADVAKTAIVCPPCIYGPGRGPDNQRSIQAYRLTELILKAKQGMQIRKGENIWTQVHVQDLSTLYLLLGEAAARGGGDATWGNEGYYFAEDGEFMWGSICKAITMDAYKKGLIPSGDVKELSLEEAEKIDNGFPYMIGSNSRCKALRAKKLLGWSCRQRRLIDEVPDIVDGEAKALGLIHSHAEKAAS
jgi:hypothetical protein